MEDGDWAKRDKRAVVVFLNGEAITEPDERGERVLDDSFLIVFNAFHEPLEVTLPAEIERSWRCTVDTDNNLEPGTAVAPGDVLEVSARSTLVFTSRLEEGAPAAARGQGAGTTRVQSPPAAPKQVSGAARGRTPGKGRGKASGASREKT